VLAVVEKVPWLAASSYRVDSHLLLTSSSFVPVVEVVLHLRQQFQFLLVVGASSSEPSS